ncbi:WYL domain-containing protein [Leeia sp. TBRC 13508]|uniref:WYL domain-containing protein n=1 Tax=Leeia speluncae TaxID=2884804 RepID=A0ABS8D396_9NEIS|nr:WYL domain-containing protein [Leeia speluncae]MCB6182650.1 WYL domain-containing protein [Leeia speluncae]
MQRSETHKDWPTLDFYIVETIISTLADATQPLDRTAISQALEKSMGAAPTKRSLQRWLQQMALDTTDQRINGPIIEYIKDGDKYKLADAWKNHRHLSNGQSLAIFMADKYLKVFSPATEDEDWKQLVKRANAQITRRNDIQNRFAILPEYMPFETKTIVDKSMKVLPAIHEAIAKSATLTFRYSSARQGGDEGFRTYTVAPIGLWQQGVRWYLAAKIVSGPSHIQGDSPTFAVVRMANVEVNDLYDQQLPTLTQYLEKHDGFGKAGDLHGFVPVKIRILDSVMEDILLETPLSKDQRIKSSVLTATIRLSKQSLYWLQSCANSLEVLEPIALREQLAATFAAAANRYQATISGG